MFIYSINRGYHVKVGGVYQWPCPGSPHRTIDVYIDDVLTIAKDGSCTMHTGIMKTGIFIPEDDLVAFDGPVHLAMTNL